MDLPINSDHSDPKTTIPPDDTSILPPDLLPEFQAWENASDHDLINFEDHLPDE